MQKSQYKGERSSSWVTSGDGGDDECEVLMMRKRRTKADAAADDNQKVCIGPQ